MFSDGFPDEVRFGPIEPIREITEFFGKIRREVDNATEQSAGGPGSELVNRLLSSRAHSSNLACDSQRLRLTAVALCVYSG